MALVAEIIAVGTELLLGNIANTDAQDISQGLSALGIHCYFHTTVGDNPARLRSALEIAASRADILITTGGLGPTYDDLTKQTVCDVFNRRLVLHEPTWERILDYFGKTGRTPTENNRQQALLPEDCFIFQNDWGTAPGCAVETNGKHVLMLPGPPRECRAMFANCAVPYLKNLTKDGTIVSRTVRLSGIGESQMEDKIRERISSAVNPTIAPYAKEGECFLRITASAPTEEEAFALTEPVVTELCELLDPYVYGVDVESLEEVVLAKLLKTGKTLAVAESCTGGMLSARITALPGASKAFLGGVIAYDSAVKTSVLGVKEETLRLFGAVSEETAIEMAKGIQKRTGADFTLSVTGLAGPGSDGSNVPVGMVHIACYNNSTGEMRHICRHMGDERHRVRTISVGTALNLVRQMLAD